LNWICWAMSVEKDPSSHPDEPEVLNFILWYG